MGSPALRLSIDVATNIVHGITEDLLTYADDPVEFMERVEFALLNYRILAKTDEGIFWSDRVPEGAAVKGVTL